MVNNRLALDEPAFADGALVFIFLSGVVSFVGPASGVAGLVVYRIPREGSAQGGTDKTKVTTSAPSAASVGLGGLGHQANSTSTPCARSSAMTAL
jgi:hypothetical protein